MNLESDECGEPQDASRSLLQLEVLSEEHELLCCLIRADGCFLVVEDPPLDLPKPLIRIAENRVACWGYARVAMAYHECAGP